MTRPTPLCAGRKRVGVVVLLARALGVEPDEEAAAPQERRQLVEARQVQRRALPVAEDGRVHREEAHHAVDERARAGGRRRRSSAPGRGCGGASPRATSSAVVDVEVEERAVVGHADDARSSGPTAGSRSSAVHVTQLARWRCGSTTGPPCAAGRGSPRSSRPGRRLARTKRICARSRRVSESSPISSRSCSRGSRVIERRGSARRWQRPARGSPADGRRDVTLTARVSRACSARG